MNKPVYLGLVILGMCMIVMYDFCFDYVNPKYGKKFELCQTDIDSFTVHVQPEDIYA